MGIGSLTRKVVKDVKKVAAKIDGKPVDKAEDKVEKKVGWLANGNDPGAAGKLKDGFVNVAGAALGEAELGAAELGINHLYGVTEYSAKVSSGLTRGSRIDTLQGYQALKAQGFRSTVDLRAEGPGDKGFGATKAGLKVCPLPIVDNTPPTEAQMKKFLDFATKKSHQPVYVHCEAGKGRTGTAVACYRMAAMGWSPEDALKEAVDMGDGVPDQQAFILQFGRDLAAGKIKGYPLDPPQT